MGGTLLTITGTGFGIERSDMKIQVDVNGVPCEVIEHDQREIKCWTDKHDSGSETVEGYRYLGKHFCGLFMQMILC